MSMFFLILRPVIKALFIISLLLSLISNALAWSGYDVDTNKTIDIGDGNLVRENLTITIFDWGTDSYHDVEIIEMESSFNGVRLEVLDLETKKKRVFEMQ
jgi:pyruvate/2-oxoglutarate/acetoin dehydrogenase E1 component